MLDTEFLTILGLGLVLGLRHALDTDHLAAVSTMLAQRPSLRASGMIGLSWGLGHTVVLLLAGAVVLVLRVPIPEPFALAVEFGVGVMLVFLGGMLAVRLVRERWHVHAHDHDGAQHVHLHSHALVEDHGHAHWWRNSIRPFCIGMAHGLAGSAALLLLVLSSARSVSEGLTYIAIFGLGSIIGMTCYLHQGEIYVRHEGGYGILPSSSCGVREWSCWFLVSGFNMKHLNEIRVAIHASRVARATAAD